jgi:hypothetical protein
MMPNLKVYAYIFGIVLCAIGLWYLHHDGYEAGKDEVQVQWDADKIQRDEAQKQALVAYANRITQAQEQHDHDQALIDQLHDDVKRVHIHLPTCSNAAATGQNPDGTAGLLPSRVDESFARLQERAGRLFARCDQLNIDAIRANAGR